MKIVDIAQEIQRVHQGDGGVFRQRMLIDQFCKHLANGVDRENFVGIKPELFLKVLAGSVPLLDAVLVRLAEISHERMLSLN